MIFPARLHEVTIIGHQEDKRAAVQALHELGVLHIARSEIASKELQEDVSMQRVDEISSILIRLEHIAKRTGVPREREQAHTPETQALIDDAKAFLVDHEQPIEGLEEEVNTLEKRQQQLRVQLEQLENIPFTLPPQKADQRVMVLRSDKKLDTKLGQVKISSAKKAKAYWYMITCTASKFSALETKIRQTTAKRISVSFASQGSKSFKEKASKELKAIQEDIRVRTDEMRRTLRGRESRLQFLMHGLECLREQETVTNLFQKSKRLFVLKGYCEKKALADLAARLPDTHISSEPAKDAPIKLNQNWWTRKFRIITELFGLPQYNSADPTFIISIFFPIFFGVMLGDIGYGILVLLLALGIKLSGNKNAQSAVPVLSISAIAAILVGIVFGSTFGGLIPTPALYTDGFSAAMTILIASLAIGLLHLNTAVIIGIVQSVRQKKSFKDIWLSYAAIPLLETTGLLLGLQQTIAGAITGSVLILTLLFAKGAFGLMDISGLFGTWFSYARLLALGLATAGVALAVNTIASSLLAIGKIGIILWVLVILIGHSFNFVMNIIGCSINAARLHYVEFFSVFYESGGKAFSAFGEKTRR